MPDDAAGKGRGRPRSPLLREAVLRGAMRLLLSDGYATLTLDAVAAASGVPKSTMYRRWDSKTQLVLEAILAYADQEIPIPRDTPVFAALTAFFEKTFALATTTPIGQALCALAAEAQADPGAARILGELVARRRAVARSILDRGVREGELRPDMDPDIVLDTLYGPFWYRLLFRHAPLDERFARDLVELVRRGLAPAGE